MPIVDTRDTIKPTWLDEHPAGEDIHRRRINANPFTANYTVNQTLRRQSTHRPRYLSIDVAPDYIGLENIVSSPVTSESSEDSVSVVKKQGGIYNSEPIFLLSNNATRREQPKWFHRILSDLVTFSKFLGPGFLVTVAYIDPGNYAIDIAAGASYKYNLLFIILLSNVIAIFLRYLAIKFGTITGFDLATASRVFLPKWLNIIVYALVEVAIVATDMSVVIGTATALHLLMPGIPLTACVVLSIIDILFVVLFYRPDGAIRGLRVFDICVFVLVLGVFVCFCIQLSLIRNTTVGQVLRGYLPSSYIIETMGLYQSCGILGATVMPHSLHLCSSIVKSRLEEFDIKEGNLDGIPSSDTLAPHESEHKATYPPSMAAIRYCMKFSVTEVVFSLFIFALFINSAILIITGASLYHGETSLAADIIGMHDLLVDSISSAAGVVFALALLFSGISAGLVCTIAGQLVSEGALNWHMRPWLRRLITRVISIAPIVAVVAVAGRTGLNNALISTQVLLSTVLPVVTAPLIYFTSFNKHMTVVPGVASYGSDFGVSPVRSFSATVVKMANPWWVRVLAVLTWLMMTVMVVANLVLLVIRVPPPDDSTKL